MSKPRIVICVEGGLIQDILADSPVEAYVIDYDTDGSSSKELTVIPQGDGDESEAHARGEAVELDKERVDELIAAIIADKKPTFKEEEK